MNINGPSAIRVPDWVENPRGRYYLYFAHHHGRDIRIAVADDLLGPWTVHGRGVLDIEATAAHAHVASPDVHVDHEQRRLRMYFHGGASGVSTDQVTFVASSKDGLDFAASPARLAPFYLRVFEHDGWFYGVGKRGNRSGILVRSEDPTAPFEAGATIIPRMRHAAVLKRDDDEAWVLYTRIGD